MRRYFALRERFLSKNFKSSQDNNGGVIGTLSETYKLYPGKKIVVTLKKTLDWSYFDAHYIILLQIIKKVQNAYEAI